MTAINNAQSLYSTGQSSYVYPYYVTADNTKTELVKKALRMDAPDEEKLKLIRFVLDAS